MTTGEQPDGTAATRQHPSDEAGQERSKNGDPDDDGEERQRNADQCQIAEWRGAQPQRADERHDCDDDGEDPPPGQAVPL